MIDLDRASLDRVRPPTPGSADWDDVMSRASTHQGHRRRPLVALAAVALLLVATATAFGVRLILDEGFTGLPPDGATPSAPESGELVLFYHGPSEFRPGFNNPTKVFVYSDGRLITTFSGAPLLEQRLTAEGVELLRSEVVSTLLRPDHPSPETKYVPFWFAVEVRDGEQPVKLSDEATSPSRVVATGKRVGGTEGQGVRADPVRRLLRARV